MQKLLSSKLAANIPKKLSNTSSSSITFHSNPYKTLSSSFHQSPLTSSPTKQPSHFFSHFYSWLTRTSSSHKIHGVFSNPLLAKQLLTSAHLRVPNKPLKEYNFALFRAQMSKKSFDFGPYFNSHHRKWRSWFSRLSGGDMVLGLIIANVAVFMLWRIADQTFMMRNFTISVDNFKSGRVHTMITSAFSHVDMGHLISNMVGLYFFGTSIASHFGPEYLLKLYLAGAIGGSIFYLLHHAFMSSSSSKGRGLWNMDPSRTPGLGASGAVNAIMLLNIFLFPKATLYFDFIIPVPAILLGIFLIGKDMLRILEGDSHISGSAHLGGAVVAAIAWRRIKMG